LFNRFEIIIQRPRELPRTHLIKFLKRKRNLFNLVGNLSPINIESELRIYFGSARIRYNSKYLTLESY
jgi:hypothetical protein